jgi:hypothetical protein
MVSSDETAVPASGTSSEVTRTPERDAIDRLADVDAALPVTCMEPCRAAAGDDWAVPPVDAAPDLRLNAKRLFEAEEERRVSCLRSRSFTSFKFLSYENLTHSNALTASYLRWS